VKLNKGVKKRARRVLIYGENGVGKSTLASQFPDPVFLNIEDGLGDIDCTSTDKIRSIREVEDIIVLDLPKTQFRTIVIDTADWLERLIFEEVASGAGKDTIEEIGFGRGYQSVEKVWKKLFSGLGFLWSQGRNIVFTCHEAIDKFADPEGDSFNYYRPALHKTGSGCVTEWCDEVLFAKYRRFTRKSDEGFNRERAIAVGSGERVLVCNKQPAIEAKNRLGFPNEIPMTIEPWYKHLADVPFNVGNVEGIVKNGSSKTEEITF
jgi:hypothetical protein